MGQKFFIKIFPLDVLQKRFFILMIVKILDNGLML